VILAYDIGGTKVRVATFSLDGLLLQEKREIVSTNAGPQGFLNQLVQLGKSIVAEGRLSAIGVATAGPVDLATGSLVRPTNLSGGGVPWEQVPIRVALQAAFEVPVLVDNDAAAATFAEAQEGVGVGCERFALLAIGTGLGTGFWHDQKVLRAHPGEHTEAGHVIIAPHHEHRCGCGNYGCAEAMLSGFNFPKSIGTKYFGNELDGPTISKLARSGDGPALQLWAEYGFWLAVFLNTVCLLLAPEKVVFTGSVVEAFDCFAEPTRNALERLIGRRPGMMPELVRSKLGNDAMLRGAFWRAKNRQQ